jgi:hypothetical protein
MTKQEEDFIPNVERKKKVRRALHPKCKTKRRKQEEHFIPNVEVREESKRSTSSQMQK